MNNQCSELNSFWNSLIKKNGRITIADIEELKDKISKVYFKMDELQKRGDKFKEKYDKLKLEKKNG
jgi:peptidoglycan hydrolase CwlO-like protein